MDKIGGFRIIGTNILLPGFNMDFLEEGHLNYPPSTHPYEIKKLKRPGVILYLSVCEKLKRR